MSNIQHILKQIRNLYPEFRQYHWDNSGIQIQLKNQIHTIALSLDITLETVEEAINKGAQIIISHHPLFFKPTKNLINHTNDGAIAIKCIQNNISLYSMHTSYDNNPFGMGYFGLQAFGIKDIKPLKEIGSTTLAKVVVFCPNTHSDKLIETLATAGAGSIGNYSHCHFTTEGCGSFMPLEGAKPYIGKIRQKESVNEQRIEMIFPIDKKGDIVQAIMRTHPYETPAYDIYKLENKIDSWGCGAIGKHPTSLNKQQLLTCIKSFFGDDPEKVYGNIDKPIQKIGFVGGAGTDFIKDAVRAKCDIYITGEIRYHDLEYARNSNTAIIQMGHGVSERAPFYACAKNIADATQCKVIICEDKFEFF